MAGVMPSPQRPTDGEVLLEDLEAERRVLACALQSEEALAEVQGALVPDDFSHLLHRQVFEIATGRFVEGQKVGIIEVLRELQKRGLTLGVEEASYLELLADSYMPATSVTYWIEQVKEKSKLRHLRRILDQLYAALGDPTVTAKDILAQAEQGILGLGAEEEVKKIFSPEEFAQRAHQRVWERMQHPNIVQGLDTGFTRLNEATAGLQPGDLVVVSAETGQGKTTFAMNLVKRIALEQRRTVLYCNTEMSEEQMGDRALAMLSGVDLNAIRTGTLDLAGMPADEAWERITAAANLLYQGKLYMSDAMVDLNLAKIASLARKYKLQFNLELLVVDYIGRLEEPGDRRYQQEYQILEQIAKGLKRVAQQLKIAVLVLAQLNDMGDLAGSKRIKNEADVLLKIYPIDYEDKTQLKELEKEGLYGKANYWIWVDKNRSGEANFKIPVQFHKSTLTIRELQGLRRAAPGA